MKSLKTILSLVLAFSLLFCLGVVATFNASAESVEIAATDARVRYTGHWAKDGDNMKGYFQSTIEVRFTGTSLQVKCNRALAVKIDGGEYEVVDPVSDVVTAASGLAEGEHKAILIISTPIAAPNGPTNTTISGFVLDSGASLLYPDAAKHIAFIGDSITMGHYGQSSYWPEGVTFRDSIAKNYAAKTAMALGMVPNGTAIGGHGIEQANSTAIDTIGMSQRYFRLGGMYTDANETVYDTNLYTPDYVVVALGTNRSYDATSAASTQVVYENMLKNLRKAYPNAKIFCVTPFQSTGLSSLSLKVNSIIKPSVDNMNAAGDDNVYFIDATGFITNPAQLKNDPTGQTTDGVHPTYDGHTAIATQLTAAIRALTFEDLTIDKINVTVKENVKQVDVVVDNSYEQIFADLNVTVGDTTVAEYAKVGDKLVFSLETTLDSCSVQLKGGNVSSDKVTVDLARMDGAVGAKYVQFVEAYSIDVNADEQTDVKDLVRMKKIVAKLADESDVADVDGDGAVAATDLTALAKIIVKGKKGVKAYTVTFMDGDAVIESSLVLEGCKATVSVTPEKDGYNFKGWDKSLANITEDTVISAVFEEQIKYFPDDSLSGTIPEDWELGD